MQKNRRRLAVGLWHQYKSVFYYIVLCLGVIFLAAGLSNGRTVIFLIGNVAILLATLFRWSAKLDSTTDSDVRLFYRAAHLLAPQIHGIGSVDQDHHRWSTKAFCKLGVLYWIDRGAILLLACSVLWLALLVFQLTHQLPKAVAVTVLVLIGCRIILRLVWVFQIYRQAGNGNFLVGVDLIDNDLRFEKKAEPHHDVEAHLNRIVSLLSEGDVEDAIEEASLLIEVRSKLPGAYGIRGVSFSAARMYHQAIEDFDRAIQLDNQYAQGFCCRGIAWTKVGDWDKARYDLSQSIKLSEGTDSGAFVALGKLHVATEEYDLANEAFARAIDLDDSLEACIGQAESLIEMGCTRDAIDTCTLLITKVENAKAYALRAWGKMLLCEYSEARADFRTAIDLSMPKGDTYAHYGYAWLLSTCPIDAIRDGHLASASVTRVQELAWVKQWEVEKLWGAVCANQNQWGDASVHQQRAIDLAPSWATENLDYQLQKYLAHEPIRSVEDNAGRVLPVFA